MYSRNVEFCGWKLVFPLDAEMEGYILDKMQANQRTAEDGTVTQLWY